MCAELPVLALGGVCQAAPLSPLPPNRVLCRALCVPTQWAHKPRSRPLLPSLRSRASGRRRRMPCWLCGRAVWATSGARCGKLPTRPAGALQLLPAASTRPESSTPVFCRPNTCWSPAGRPGSWAWPLHWSTTSSAAPTSLPRPPRRLAGPQAPRTAATSPLQVAKHIPGKTGQQCAQRWRHRVNPNISREKWTAEASNTGRAGAAPRAPNTPCLRAHAACMALYPSLTACQAPERLGPVRLPKMPSSCPLGQQEGSRRIRRLSRRHTPSRARPSSPHHSWEGSTPRS